MSIKRWATRKDATQRLIIQALEAVNCEVWVIERPCDLLTLYRGRWLPIECKTPQPNGKVRQRADQVDQAVTLQRARIPVVTTPVEALRAIGAMS
jgi:hypothetical protein